MTVLWMKNNYITNEFNNFNDWYFVNIGPKLASKIPQLGIEYKNVMPHPNDISFFLSPAEESEVKKMFYNWKTEHLTMIE